MDGLDHPSIQTHYHIPPLPFSGLEFLLCSSNERFEQTISLGGLDIFPLQPTSIIPPPPFSECDIYVFRDLDAPEPGTYGTF